MIRVLFFLAALVLIILVLNSNNSKLTKTIKAIICLFFVGLCIFGYFYENKKQKVNYAKRDAIILAYKQNKTLKCGNYDVNKTNFDIAEALSSFTSKRGVSDEFKGLVIKMKECETDE